MKTKIFLLIFAISVIAFCLCSFTPYEEFDLDGEYQLYSDIRGRLVTDGMPSGSYNLPVGACEYNTLTFGDNRYALTQIVFDSENSRVTIYPGAKVIIDGGLIQSSDSFPDKFFFDSDFEIPEDVKKFFYLNHGVSVSERISFDFSNSIQDFNTLPFGYEVDKTGAHGFELIGNYSSNSELFFDYIYLYAGNMSYVNTNSENGELFNTRVYSYNNGWIESFKYHILGISNTFVPNWLLCLFELNELPDVPVPFVSGVRVWNTVLDLSLLSPNATGLNYIISGDDTTLDFMVPFVSNSTAFEGIIYDFVGPVTFEFEHVYSLDSGWVDGAFRFVDFGEGYLFEEDSILYEFIIQNSRALSGLDYGSGYTDGYINGFDNGISSNIFGDFLTDMFVAPVRMLQGLIIYSDGVVVVSLWSIISVCFMISVLGWILRLIAGG